MAIGGPKASDATSPRGPCRARDGVRIATAAQRRTAQARLCCFARNDGDPGSPRGSARGVGVGRGRKSGPAVVALALEAQPSFGQIRPLKRPFGAGTDGWIREMVCLAPDIETRPASIGGRCPEPGQSAHSPSLQRRECCAPRGLSAATRPPSSTRSNPAAWEGEAGAPDLRSLPAKSHDADDEARRRLVR